MPSGLASRSVAMSNVPPLLGGVRSAKLTFNWVNVSEPVKSIPKIGMVWDAPMNSPAIGETTTVESAAAGRTHVASAAKESAVTNMIRTDDFMIGLPVQMKVLSQR